MVKKIPGGKGNRGAQRGRHNGKPKTPGGARAGAGRKPADGKSGSRRQVVLDDETIEICRQAGGGELSAGIRAVAAAYRGFLAR